MNRRSLKKLFYYTETEIAKVLVQQCLEQFLLELLVNLQPLRIVFNKITTLSYSRV